MWLVHVKQYILIPGEEQECYHEEAKCGDGREVEKIRHIE